MNSGGDALIIAALLFLYILRDSEALRLGIAGLPFKRVLAYGFVIVSAVTAVSKLAESMDAASYVGVIRHWSVAGPLLAVHVGIFIYYLSVRRAGDLRRMWTTLLIPSPVLVLSLVGISIVLSRYMLVLPAALLVSYVWVGMVINWARWNTGAAVGDDPAWGLALIAIANLWAVLLVPAGSVTRCIDTLGDIIRFVLVYD